MTNQVHVTPGHVIVDVHLVNVPTHVQTGTLVYTRFEPVRRWYGLKRCRWTLELHYDIEGLMIANVPLHHGWTRDAGVGYQQITDAR